MPAWRLRENPASRRNDTGAMRYPRLAVHVRTPLDEIADCAREGRCATAIYQALKFLLVIVSEAHGERHRVTASIHRRATAPALGTGHDNLTAYSSTVYVRLQAPLSWGDDHGASGARAHRAELDRLMAGARQRTFDMVRVYRFDRPPGEKGK